MAREKNIKKIKDELEESNRLKNEYKEKIEQYEQSRIIKIVNKLPNKVKTFLLGKSEKRSTVKNSYYKFKECVIKIFKNIISKKDDLKSDNKGGFTVIITFDSKDKIKMLIDSILNESYINYNVIILSKKDLKNDINFIYDKRIQVKEYDNDIDLEGILNYIQTVNNTEYYIIIKNYIKKINLNKIQKMLNKKEMIVKYEQGERDIMLFSFCQSKISEYVNKYKTWDDLKNRGKDGGKN